MTTATPRPWTAEELGRLPAGWRYEIDEGQLVIMVPAGFEHGRLQARLARILGNFVAASGWGEVVGGESGFFVRRHPDTLRAPDVAVYSQARLARIVDRQGFPDVPPDLVVEIHDPSEPDLDRKVQQYLEAGVRAVWVVDPRVLSLTRYAPGE
ncbi:MAG TPA: Uma2 family endonuclease, partial [Bacillota bacterium]